MYRNAVVYDYTAATPFCLFNKENMVSYFGRNPSSTYINIDQNKYDGPGIHSHFQRNTILLKNLNSNIKKGPEKNFFKLRFE